MVYFGILCETMPLMVTIKRRNCHQYSESCILSTVNSGTITYAANIMFMWYPVTTWWGLFSSTQVRISYIYWYAQKNFGYNSANSWEIYFYLPMYLLFFVAFYCQQWVYSQVLFKEFVFAFIIRFTFSDRLWTLFY